MVALTLTTLMSGLGASLLWLTLVPQLGSPLTPPVPQVSIISGSNPDGSATIAWLELLRRRLDAHTYDSVAMIRHTRTAPEQAWARLIELRAEGWPDAVTALPSLFDLGAPERVRVIVGDRGGDDAFTHDSVTMGFDVAALQRTYGDANLADNAARLDRFFRHEYVHLLQKRWLARHPYRPGSPLELALLDAWEEGMGNYYSLSPAWYPAEGLPSPQTVRALGELQPRFVDRMAALACADSTTAQPLLADLSAGPFTQKWGALPVALWLLDELQTDSIALRRFARAGPSAVWALASRHLPGPLADSLSGIRRQAASCRTVPR